MRKALLSVSIMLASLGITGTSEAQNIRSYSTRPAYSGHHYSGYRGHVGYRGHYGGYRGYRSHYGGYRGYGGWYGGIRIGFGYSNYGYGYRSYYAPRYYGPSVYVARPPLLVDNYYTPQYPVVVERAPVLTITEDGGISDKPAAKTVTLQLGEVQEINGVVVANIDGQLVILKAAKEE